MSGDAKTIANFSQVDLELPALLGWISDDSVRVFALLDACDEPLVQKLVADLGERVISLYRGAAQLQYWAIAPYVAEVDAGVVDYVSQHLDSGTWGYFLITNASCELQDLRRHFRKFLTVQSPEGEEMYFRFYDPRVLPAFFESSTSDELVSFFGPVQRMVLPAEWPGLVSLGIGSVS